MFPFRWNWRLIFGFALSLVLVACDSGGQARERQPSGADNGPVVIVSTVEVEEEPEIEATAAATPVPTITPTATPPAPLAALVNGEYVFLDDFEERFSQYQQALFDQGLDPNTEDGQAMLAQARLDVLEGMIDSLLVEQG
ncbi:MAG: hypothetical protein ACP5JJ_19510, partial [Anaerolineae bacterium]